MAKISVVPVVLLMAAFGGSGCMAAKEEAPSMATASPNGGGSVDPQAPAGGKPEPKLPSTARKVIRSAELSIEVASPASAETKVSSLVQGLGGYIATSSREVMTGEGEQRSMRVSLSLRVPADRLDEALREIKRLGGGAEVEKIGSEDVTDEYIDVGARVANQRHLEQQLVTILAQANKVDDAMKVHQELATVRTEIDRLEGRKRFLESESAMAKLTLSLEPLRPVVGFTTAQLGVNVRKAATDSVSVAGGILTFCIRAAGVLLPVAVLFGLPLFGLGWALRRRQRRLVAALSA
jgi:hypothetical protein